MDMEEIESLKTQIAEKEAEVDAKEEELEALEDDLANLRAEYDEAVSELLAEIEA